MVGHVKMVKSAMVTSLVGHIGKENMFDKLKTIKVCPQSKIINKKT